jgi:hypothetical protein
MVRLAGSMSLTFFVAERIRLRPLAFGVKCSGHVLLCLAFIFEKEICRARFADNEHRE